MIYRIPNLITGTFEYIETNEADANAKLLENQTAYLLQENYRFTVAKEIVDGNNTTWTNADLENDPENGNYFVFNTMTGLHEKANSLTEAKQLFARIKQDFLVFVQLDKWEIVDKIPNTNLEQPITTGTQTI